MKNKKMRTKTFKCGRCKEIFPALKLDYRNNRLVDYKKYINQMIVCRRCWDRIKEESRLRRLIPTKKPYPTINHRIKW